MVLGFRTLQGQVEIDFSLILCEEKEILALFARI